MKQEAILETIRLRRSCRSYDGQPLSAELRAQVTGLLERSGPGPFGGRLRAVLLDATDRQRSGEEKLGSYGVIRGAPHFLAGAIRQDRRALEDFGYLFEDLVLELTALGLGTCWLGGTFRRSAFSAALQAGPEDLVPAVSPLGFAGRRFNPADRFFRWAAGSDRRKPFGELFFAGGFDRPLGEEEAALHAPLLEAVRLAPSASNRQPWRIVRDAAGTRLRFFLCRTPGYAAGLPVDLQRVDLGIALCHLERAAQAVGLAGHWCEEPQEPETLPPRTEYVVSWISDHRS